VVAPILAPSIDLAQSERTEAPATAPGPGFAHALGTQLQSRAPLATPLRGSEAASALSDAYTSVFGEAPSKQTLSVLVAQWSLETGGGHAMMNYNFGGIKGQAPGGGTVAYRTTEGSGEGRRTIVDNFRAYGSAREGAVDYVHLLARRFPAAMTQARLGNPAGFVHALKQAGYFTGSEADYARAVTATASRVQSAGFDAAGAGGGASLAGAGGDRGADAQMAAVDVMSFSQELTLAALRIGEDRSDSGALWGANERR